MVGRICDDADYLQKILELEVFFLSPRTYIHAEDLLLKRQGAAVVDHSQPRHTFIYELLTEDNIEVHQPELQRLRRKI